jgi:hypothetical protein
MTANNNLKEKNNTSVATNVVKELFPKYMLASPPKPLLTPTTTRKSLSNPLIKTEPPIPTLPNSTEQNPMLSKLHEFLKILTDEFEKDDYYLLKNLEVNRGLDKFQKLLDLDTRIEEKTQGKKGNTHVNIINIDGQALRRALEDIERLGLEKPAHLREFVSGTFISEKDPAVSY